MDEYSCEFVGKVKNALVTIQEYRCDCSSKRSEKCMQDAGPEVRFVEIVVPKDTTADG